MSGNVGNLVYAVAPAQLSAERAQPCRFEGTFAILLTRDVGDLGPSWIYFIVAGGTALAVAALVAWQMSRRMARPLVEAEEVTGRIAVGRADQPAARPAQRLPRVRLARRFDQRHGAEPRGQPRP